MLATATVIAILGTASVAPTPSASAQEPAGTPIEVYGMTPGTLPEQTQAGGHPDLQVGFTLKNAQNWAEDDGLQSPCFCQNARFITAHAPAGLLGSPSLIPKCTAAQFAAITCPVDSQVGIVNAQIPVGSGNDGLFPTVPIYNLVPRAGEPGLVGYVPVSVPILQTFAARTESDYGLDSTVILWNGQPVRIANELLWGVPADPKHDALRFPFGEAGAGSTCDANGNLPTPSPVSVLASPIPPPGDPFAPPSGPDSFVQLCTPAQRFSTPSNSPEVPFISAPTKCSGEQPTTIDVLAYDGVTTHAASTYPAATGCDLLSFNPSLVAKPTTSEADSPSGLDITLTVPQPQDPNTPSPSSIRGTKMTLPPGFTVNSAAADGKTACTDAQAAFGTRDAAQCPEDAKVGSLEIETAVLPGPLEGYLYLGQPLPGNRYRVFLAADGFGVHIKLPGTIDPNPATGQLSVIFDDLPQAPFEKFSLHVFGAERGALATPEQCGTYPVKTEFIPWDDQLATQTTTQFFTIDSGPGGGPCPPAPRPFGPSFAAGSQGNAPAAHSPFVVDIARGDGEQDLAGVTVTLPMGFAATLKGIPYCPEAAIARLQSGSLYSGVTELNAPICPASRIGSVAASAGAGSKPLNTSGHVYLAGPYKGAPLSLVVVVPAVSGPYDLGNVAVRAKIDVDPVTAIVTTTTDPLPQIIEGIPLRAKHIRTAIDRPNFALTPTDCSPLSTEAQISGAEGGAVSRSAPYQLANCANLPFAPKLYLRLKGGSRRSAHPALRATLIANEGDANLAYASVALPHSEFLDQAHIRTICTRVQFAARNCPDGAIYGHAAVFTPILDQPLRGPVYLRSSNNPLPDLVMDLHGQVGFNAISRIDTVNGGIRSTFDFIPDIPISKVVLSMQGGERGLLVNSRNICKGTPKAVAKYRGHNNAPYKVRVPLKADCGKKTRRAKRSYGHGRRTRVLSARTAG